ncbi:hypothetical protein AB1N83_007005 [Pleurotus pulmonarius]
MAFVSFVFYKVQSASEVAKASAVSGGTSRTRPRSSSTQYPAYVHPSKFLFTPADLPAAPPLRTATARKVNSSPVLHSPHTYPLYPLSYPSTPSSESMKSDSEEYDDGHHEGELDGVIWHAPHSLSSSQHGAIRARVGVYGKGRDRDREGGKLISTTPGMLGAGETETEADEPPKRLPTARIIPSHEPLIPPNSLQERLTPLLFEFSRLLSVVPAIIGTLYNLYFVFYGAGEYARGRPERVDYAVAALWSILTGFQCLALTTGLLTRWRIYYTPLSTLVRLLGLQAICWPATNWTLRIFDGGMFEGAARRPVIVWAIIGTTTCVSRSVQIWVTSNLWWERDDQPHTNSNAPSPKSATSHSHSQAHHYQHHAHNRPRGSVTSLLQNSFPSLPNFPSPAGVGVGSGVGVGGARANGRGGYWKRWRGGKWGGRRWDWREVGVKCVLPAGIVYVVMAWAEALRREWRGC